MGWQYWCWGLLHKGVTQRPLKLNGELFTLQFCLLFAFVSSRCLFLSLHFFSPCQHGNSIHSRGISEFIGSFEEFSAIQWIFHLVSKLLEIKLYWYHCLFVQSLAAYFPPSLIERFRLATETSTKKSDFQCGSFYGWIFNDLRAISLLWFAQWDSQELSDSSQRKQHLLNQFLDLHLQWKNNAKFMIRNEL